ncbi:hypothetical protein WJX84_003839 [Apatococcus fuscideae]|uniref:RAVE complex protein Rav1 C-terminal domain-containing protein n=1 Tax=Apatococcus fuscideae TaxID=2026836 RepID=A0AAW1SX38_9CHLO
MELLVVLQCCCTSGRVAKLRSRVCVCNLGQQDCLQWSPGALQKGVSYSSDEEGDGAAAEQVGASHPALLTLTVEGTMRIWVEVTMESVAGQSFGPALPVVGSHRETPAPGSAHFCMSLVIESPEGAFAKEPGSLRACWGTPLGLATSRGAGQRAAKVMWIVAIGKDGSESEGERLLLWVVDGLASVVISAIPNNVVGSKLLSSPRAVLWGEHQGLLSWPLRADGRADEQVLLSQLSCSVGVEEDAPVLHVFESLRMRVGHEAPADLRCYRIDTVDEVVQGRRSPRAGPAGDPEPWNLSLQAFCQHQLDGVVKLLATRTRPTSHHTTRLLANLTLPPSQTISVNALYSLEGLQSSRGLLALCQPAHTDYSSQEPVTAKAGILVLWRVPTSVRARSPLQLRGPPAALDPTRTWSFSELGLTAGSHEGLNPELVHSTADSVHLTVLTTVPSMRMPAVILGGPSGICCLAFSTQTASAGEKPDLKALVTMRGSCPPGAGQQTALAASSHACLVAAGFQRPNAHRRSSSGLLAIWQPLPPALSRIPSTLAGTSIPPTASPGGPGAWQLCLVAEVAVSGPPTALCWLDNLQAVAPALAVAQGPASLTIYAQLPRQATGSAQSWSSLLTLQASSLPVGALSVTSTGRLLAGLSSQLAALQSAHPEPNPTSTTQRVSLASGSLVQALQHAAQIPDYHPAALQINILGNRRMGAVASVQHLLASLQPPPSPESSPDGPQKHVASKTPPQPLRMSVDAQPSRRPSQNGAQALTSPAAAYANGQRLAVDPSSPATAADPGAFDPGAFGFGVPEDPAEDQEHPTITKAGTPAADPGAFDPGAFGFGDEEAVRNRQTSSQHASTSGRSSAAAAGSSNSFAASWQAVSQARQRKPRKVLDPLQNPTERTELHDDEFAKLQALLQKLIATRTAYAEGQSYMDYEDPEDAAERARLQQASHTAKIGQLDAARLEQLLALTQLLLKDVGRPDMDLTGLDLAAQQALIGIQVAAISGARPDMSGAQNAHSQVGQASMLMDGLRMSSILWALLSATPVRLIDTCLKVVHVKEQKFDAIQPKIEFTSRGVGRLDLGFGAERKQQGLKGIGVGQHTWPALRACGAGFWLRDASMARAEAEAVAKATYAATRDPSDVALFYMGLGRKPLLQGLLRSSQQVKLADFLNRDFSESKNKEAACKNAFVLLGQHRYEMAAAFFLLGGAQQDAVGVCATEIADPQLALFLCHLLEGPQGPLQHHLITSQLLSNAEDAEDEWSVCVLNWLLGRVGPALSALIPCQPIHAGSYPPAGILRHAEGLMRPVEPALLGLLRHCWDQNWLHSLPPASLQTVAVGSALALEEYGCTLLALEALQVAELAGAPPAISVSSPTQDVLIETMGGWKARLAAAALAPSAFCTVHQDSARGSQQHVLHQLQALAGAGISLDAQAVESLLEKLAAAREPPAALPGQRRRSMELVTSPSGLSEASLLSRASRRTSQSSQRHLGVVEDGLQLFSIDGDRTHAICASAVGEWVAGAGEGRPIVVASSHHGLVETELLSEPLGAHDDLLSTAASDGNHKGTTFTTMLTGMLEAVRWPPDPWALIAPNQGGGNDAVSPRVQAKRAHISTATLCAHPSRPIYVSGCSTGEIYLWHFGQRMASAGYTPLPASAPSIPSTSSLFSAPSKAWNPHTPGVSFAQWGQPQAVRFSNCGEHFAAVGEGGVVATWRVDAPRYLTTDTGSLGRAEWCHQGLARKGVDVVYVGGSNTVLAVGGQGTQGANIVLWDTNSHPRAPPVARITHHSSLVTALQMLPGGQLLASGDEMGELAVKDLRMLGQSSSTVSKQTVWSRQGGHSTGPGSGISCLAIGPKPSGRLLLASGSRDGRVCLWSPDKGSLQQAVHMSSPPPQPAQNRLRGKGFFSELLRPKTLHNTSGVVSGVAMCPDGLLTCSIEGLVHFHKFS